MRTSFVLVLVDADADAYLFDAKYYSQDPAGDGERAAIGLQTAVREYLEMVNPRLAALPVVARAFASGDGLARLLGKAGIVRAKESQQFLASFTSGFSQADDMFDFVLVGAGKDRADHKLTGVFRQFVESPSCQHVFLACCHDNGYVRMLEKYVHNPEVVSKVTMVKSSQTGSEFGGLPFRSMTMGSVFNSRPLNLGAGLPFTATATKAGGEPASTIQGSPPPLSRSPTQTSKSSSPSTTYASRTAAVQAVLTPPTVASRPLPIFGTREPTIILVNDDDWRIDMPLPAKSPSAIEAFNRKTYGQGKRYCNAHHLQGRCPGNCGYLHDLVTPKEKLVMRHQLRGRKCHDRGKCRDALCYYSHHCACPGGSKCTFPIAMHGIDVASWREVNTAGSAMSA
ncbi:hypothetical protein BT67DRAFT_441826, partial [Trichocladium antarcticum]